MSRLLLLASTIIATHAFAQAPAAPAPATPPAPTADEIKRVLDYMENGKEGGPVLLELVPCAKVDTTKNSPTIWSCLEPITGPVKKNTTVNAWMSWFCPKGGVYEDLSVQFLHEGQVRQTIDLKIEGFSRTRSFRSHTFGKAGKWQIKVLRGDKEVGAASVTVE